VLITSDAEVIREADRVVFPGVGAIRDCMAEIRRLGFRQRWCAKSARTVRSSGSAWACKPCSTAVKRTAGSTASACSPVAVKFFGKDLHENGEHLKVPHMGWNEVRQHRRPPAVA
jgi:imidazole glycerol-phosphate synthase subunit HisH